MMVSASAITGMMLGFELVSKKDIGEDSGFLFVFDIFIIRLIIESF